MKVKQLDAYRLPLQVVMLDDYAVEVLALEEQGRGLGRELS